MEFKATPTFAHAFKRLRKKYRNLPEDIERLRLILTQNPTAGIPLGAELYKIRLSSSDMKKGKRGAFRIAYYLVVNEETNCITRSLHQIRKRGCSNFQAQENS